MPISAEKKPLIAVTGPDRGGTLAWLFTWFAIRRAGGRAIHVTPARHADTEVAFDGLVIGGGADVDPGLYGEQPAATPFPPANTSLLRRLAGLILYPLLFFARKLFSSKQFTGLDSTRDRLEFRLLEQALDQHKPVLGICRGAQLINVYLQGSLHQDTTTFYTETPRAWSVLPVKAIAVLPDSDLYRILETPSCKVNALHRQSIDRIGRDIRVSAREDNGVIQAIEYTQRPYLIGVQWHPEYLPHHARQQRLFRKLITYARDARQGSA